MFFTCRPKSFSVEIEKPVYFPGETVKGFLKIINIEKIYAYALRLKLEGVGLTSNTGYFGGVKQRRYCCRQKMLWGSLAKTPHMECKDIIIFNPPHSSEEGLLQLVVDGSADRIILNVMLRNEKKQDTLVCETCISITDVMGQVIIIDHNTFISRRLLIIRMVYFIFDRVLLRKNFNAMGRAERAL